MNTNWTQQGRVLVLGARGMLGQELVKVLGERVAPEHLVAWDLDELDICDEASVRSALDELAPAVVINAAAYTDVDGCETNQEVARAANGEAPGYVAGACIGIGATMVHFGTDFVFDGQARRPYRPMDAANPLSVYGRSKWEGEEAIRQTGCRHLIVRTSWLFGLGGRNFVEAIRSKAISGERLRVVDDQVGRPTLASDLAVAVMRLLDHGAAGTLHYANSGACSWYEFAKEIVQQAGAAADVTPIKSAELGRPAHRPAYSVLDTSGYEELTNDHPAPWKDALSRYLAARDSQGARAERISR